MPGAGTGKVNKRILPGPHSVSNIHPEPRMGRDCPGAGFQSRILSAGSITPERAKFLLGNVYSTDVQTVLSVMLTWVWEQEKMANVMKKMSTWVSLFQ